MKQVRKEHFKILDIVHTLEQNQNENPGNQYCFATKEASQ